MMTATELRDWRADHHLTQQALATRLMIDAQTISRWERQERPMPPFLGLALAGLEVLLDQEWSERTNSPTPVADTLTPSTGGELAELDAHVQAICAEEGEQSEVSERTPAAVSGAAAQEPQHRPAPMHVVRGEKCSCEVVLGN